jgi:hypothetical protein
MDDLDGNILKSYNLFLCERGHALGVIIKRRVRYDTDKAHVNYKTPRVYIFRDAVDLQGQIPKKIVVSGFMDGNMLRMRWRCNVSGCGCETRWDPNKDALDWLNARYGKKEDVMPQGEPEYGCVEGDVK